jgi:hypothetical protein
MKTISHVGETPAELTRENGFAIETTFVLFFLALEFGQALSVLSLDNVLLAVTLMMVAVLPYFLATEEKPSLTSWLVGRGLITAFAIFLGWMFKQTLGVVLPETFRFLPMTLLIVTAMISCYIQFYGFLKLREVK